MKYKLYFFSIFVVIIAGCSQLKDEKKDNNYFLRLNETPKTYDPAFVVDVTEGQLCVKLFSGLLRFNNSFQIIPDLAESYTVSDNGLEIYFKLKKNLKYSDGSPITTKDVVNSWTRLLSPENPSPRKWVLEKIQGAKDFSNGKTKEISGINIQSSTEFTIFLETRFSPFLSLLTMPSAAIVKIKQNGEFDEKISSGPYKLLEWKKDQFIKLLPNINYHEQGKRPALIFKIILEDSSAVAMFATKELDILKLPKTQIHFIKKRFPDNKLYQIEELNTYYLGFNHRNSKIDYNFKRACKLSVNKELIIKSIFSGNAQKAETPVPPVLIPNIKIKNGLIIDQEKAQIEFKQSSMYGEKIVFLVPSRKEALSVAVIIQDQLKQAGMSVELKVLDWTAFKEAVSKGEGDIFYMSWWADYADVENFLFPTFYSQNKGSLGNRTHYDNKNIDVLLSRLQTEYDLEKKDLIVEQILTTLEKELPWIPLWHRVSSFIISDKVKGFYPKPLYSMDKGLSYKIEDR